MATTYISTQKGYKYQLSIYYPFLVIFFDYCTFLVVITTSFEVVSRYLKANWLKCTENVQKNVLDYYIKNLSTTYKLHDIGI